VPADRVEMFRVVQPEDKLPVPRALVPSMKVTTPVGSTVVFALTDAVNVSVPPKPIDGFELTTTVVVAAFMTVCATAEDELPAKFASPLYAAVMECGPGASVVHACNAPQFSVTQETPAGNETVPIAVGPSRKVIVPVGVPPDELVTLAVNVTTSPNVDEFAELTRAVLVVTLPVIVCVSGVELPPVKPVLPP